jgi:CheY-like chemotaxis protein
LLLAEDNAINQRVARFVIEKLGHKLDIAENGEVAIEKFQQNDYDIIFMDIQMPVMDGLTATEAIRKIEQETGTTTRIPIVAMTANTMKGDKEKFLKAGMNDYVGKPFKSEELSRIICKIVSGAG